MKKSKKKFTTNCRIDRLLEGAIAPKSLNKLTVAEQSLCAGASNIFNNEIQFKKCKESLLDASSLINFNK